ncbi:hypothetical protein MCO_01050 [Bartonella sp. DB5-6]|nr:hypothetical protein MCO_01050 [Bartonella sp. DB5-6]
MCQVSFLSMEVFYHKIRNIKSFYYDNDLLSTQWEVKNGNSL